MTSPSPRVVPIDRCARHQRGEVAAILPDVLGRAIVAARTPVDQFASQLPEGPVCDGMMRMTAHYDRYGFAGGNALVLRSILGREPRFLANYFSALASR